jgi:hypothetical protein
VLADGAFDADPLRAAIAAHGALAVIPTPTPRAPGYPPFDRALYTVRHLIEGCFSKLKQFRRVATHYEKQPATILPSSPSQQPSSGSGKCPHSLEPVLGPVAKSCVAEGNAESFNYAQWPRAASPH